MTARLFLFQRLEFCQAAATLPRSWDELFAAGPEFRRRLGDGFFPLDLIFPGCVALWRAWIVQRSGCRSSNERNRRLNASAAEPARIRRGLSPAGSIHVIPRARERASYGNVQQQEMRRWIDGR